MICWQVYAHVCIIVDWEVLASVQWKLQNSLTRVYTKGSGMRHGEVVMRAVCYAGKFVRVDLISLVNKIVAVDL